MKREPADPGLPGRMTVKTGVCVGGCVIRLGRLFAQSKARFPLPELTGDQFSLPVNTGRVDGHAFPLAELTGRVDGSRQLG